MMCHLQNSSKCRDVGLGLYSCGMGVVESTASGLKGGRFRGSTDRFISQDIFEFYSWKKEQNHQLQANRNERKLHRSRIHQRESGV
ncbi:hypothetical protein AOLI_G00198060 [Acnodon oligacanthus]